MYYKKPEHKKMDPKTRDKYIAWLIENGVEPKISPDGSVLVRGMDFRWQLRAITDEKKSDLDNTDYFRYTQKLGPLGNFFGFREAERVEVSTLDEVSSLEISKGPAEIIREVMSPLDQTFTMITKDGQPQRTITTEFSFPMNGKIEFSQISSNDTPGCQTKRFLCSPLLKFVEANGPRAVYIGKTQDKKFEVIYYDGVVVRKGSRLGFPQTRYVYGDLVPPYNVPHIEDVLNDAGFHFERHAQFENPLTVGTELMAGVFGLKRDVESLVLGYCDECFHMRHFKPIGLLAVLPSFRRNKNVEDFEYMDIYLR